MFADEVATYSQQQAMKILWDLEKFYDSIKVPKLIQRACELGYPVQLLALGTQMHCAPRIIRAYHHHVYCEHPANSIIAGRTQSNQFARIMLHTILEGTINHVPTVKLRSFVDDICQTSYGSDALEDMIDSAKELVAGFKSSGLKISTKSKILSTSREWGRVLARSLAKMGVTVTVTHQAKDLGIDSTLGIKRTTTTIKKRILAGRRRTFRIKILRQATHKAAKLFPAGAMPQASVSVRARSLC